MADVDVALNTVVAAGATLLMGPEDMFWGDWHAWLSDPFSHQWSLATPAAGPDPEAEAAMMDGFHEGGDE
jgi:PhnB protein